MEELRELKKRFEKIEKYFINNERRKRILMLKMRWRKRNTHMSDDESDISDYYFDDFELIKPLNE